MGLLKKIFKKKKDDKGGDAATAPRVSEAKQGERSFVL